MTELKVKIPNILHETLCRKIAHSGEVTHSVRYDLNLQGRLEEVGEWPDGREKREEVLFSLYEHFPHLSLEECYELWKNRRVFIG